MKHTHLTMRPVFARTIATVAVALAALPAAHAAGDALEGELARTLVDPALEDLRALASDAARLGRLVELGLALREKAGGEKDLARRRQILAGLEKRITAGVGRALGGGEEAEKHAGELVRRAAEKVRARRQQYLLDNLKCDCKNEDWSRTLNGCWEDCANPQRRMVESWLDEGLTNGEVIDRMVAETGTERVLVVPRSPVSSFSPFIFLAIALAFVGTVLVVLRRRSQAALAGEEGADLDPAMEARLEKELGKLED